MPVTASTDNKAFPGWYLKGAPLLCKVGADQVEYIIHGSLACARAKFFEPKLKEPWKDSSKTIQQVELPDVTEEAFRWFGVWLYEKRLAFADDKEPWVAAMTAYRTADFFCCDGWMNDIVDFILSRQESQVLQIHHLEAFKETDYESKLGQVMLKSFVFAISRLPRNGSKTENISKHPKLAVNIVKTWVEFNSRPWGRLMLGNAPEYHVQTKTKERTIA